MPLNECYSYFIVQKTIHKDRKITKRFPKGQSSTQGEGKFSTMFDRVRVCTLCFRIYKELENYYFKELRRNLAMDEDAGGEMEDTERLMNREIKGDKEDADPRMRVDKQIGNLVNQMAKNMEKQDHNNRVSSMSRNVLSGGSGSKGEHYKTLDPKQSQQKIPISISKKSSDVKLPPISAPPVKKARPFDARSEAAPQQAMTRNRSQQ